MVAAVGAQTFVPAAASLTQLRAAVDGCRGCDLFEHATQAVFSEGPARARVVMVGETPGDIEDRRGRPFVGPGGGVLRRALDEVGLPARQVYLTNAVKHFKFHLAEGSKRRLHDTPRRSEIVACQPWLRAELDLLRPRLVVALGATAAQSLAGPSVRVTRDRGQVLDWAEVADEAFAGTAPSARFLATVHPAAVLRADDQAAAYQEFLADLAAAAGSIDPPPSRVGFSS